MARGRPWVNMQRPHPQKPSVGSRWKRNQNIHFLWLNPETKLKKVSLSTHAPFEIKDGYLFREIWPPRVFFNKKCIPVRVSPTDFRPQGPKTIPFCYHFVKQVNQLVWRHFVVLFLRTFSNGFSRSFRWYPCRGTFHQIEIEGSQKKASLTKL